MLANVMELFVPFLLGMVTGEKLGLFIGLGTRILSFSLKIRWSLYMSRYKEIFIILGM